MADVIAGLTVITEFNPLSPYGKTIVIGKRIIRDFVSSHKHQALPWAF
jgi:hypothetical protein